MADETTQVPSPADEKTSAATEARPLGFLMDVRLQVSVELGRRRYRISELLSLDQGEILELDKVAGEPLDIRVNDHLIARGEAVVLLKASAARQRARQHQRPAPTQHAPLRQKLLHAGNPAHALRWLHRLGI